MAGVCVLTNALLVIFLLDCSKLQVFADPCLNLTCLSLWPRGVDHGVGGVMTL